MERHLSLLLYVVVINIMIKIMMGKERHYFRLYLYITVNYRGKSREKFKQLLKQKLFF